MSITPAQDRKLDRLHKLGYIEGAALLIALVLFLIFISNALDRINDSVGQIDRSAQTVDRSANSLPGLVTSITDTLVAIEKDAGPIHGQLDQINGGLDTTKNGLAKADSDLSSIEGKLAHIETGLIGADGFAKRVDQALISDNALLGTGSAQASQVDVLAPSIKKDSGSILTQANAIQGHLANIVGKIGVLPGLF
jgi:hypothetical protein